MATMKEIAERAGVTIGTVDRALHNRGRINKKTREKILAIAEELNYKPNKIAQGLVSRKKKLKICYFIPNCNTNPFFKDVRNGAEKKARELKFYGVDVAFFTVSSDSENNFFIENCSSDKIAGFDGMVTFGARFTQMTQYLQVMEKNERPVVFYNEKLNNRDFLAYVGCDYYNSGRLAAGLCALVGNTDAKVCVLSQGLFDFSVFSSRMKGFNEERKKRYPNMKVLDYLSVGTDPVDNYITAVKMLEKYPDVNVAYISNPRDYDICRAIYLADKKRQVKIITNDLVEPAIGMIDDEIISATICQEPEKQGALSLEILFRYLAFGENPEKKIFYTDLSIHIAQNID